MNELRFQFRALPASGEPSTSADIPGRIIISVVGPSGGSLKTVVDQCWNVREFLEWLRDNEHALLQELIPLHDPSCDSIASTLARFYENVEPDDDDILDAVFGYRRAHGLRFAMRGTDIPDAYMGLFRGDYEVSLCDKGERWKYTVDLPAFVAQVLDSLGKIGSHTPDEN